MEIKGAFIFWLLILHVNFCSSSKFSQNEISHLMSDAKADLARSFFEKELENKENKQLVNLTHVHFDELDLPNSGENVRIFRSSNQSYLFSGTDLFRLQKRNSPLGRYTLHAVDDVRLDEGAVFFKNAEWKQKVFLVVCYQRGYCEVRISSSFSKSNLKLKINTGRLPLDVTFFADDHDFFMIVVLDPVILYRWTGTYFNEDYRLETIGAQSVAVIQDGDKSIIVVAQNLGRNKVYSKVFIRKDNAIELFQLLATHQALRIFPFTLIHGEDQLHFIFVLNNAQSSSIFWWMGKEFVHWTSINNLRGQRVVHIGEIDSKTFFFISDENKLYVYHPTVTNFDLIQIITFDQNIVGIDLRKEKDQMPMLVTLTGSPLDPYFKVNLILLKVVCNYIEKERKDSNKITECLNEIKVELDWRRQKLDEIFKGFVELKQIKMGKNPFNETVDNLVADSLDEIMAELEEKLDDMETRLKDAEEENFGDGKGRKYHVHGDLTIDQMEANVIDVEILNGKRTDFKNFLSFSKNQTFSGTVDMDTLKTSVLNVPSLNGILIEEIMVRNKPLQKISGDFTLESLKANDIRFGPAARLNKIPATSIVVNGRTEKPIRGLKTFSELKVQQIEVDKINNVPSNEWLARILPSFKDASEGEPLSFANLSVEKLWISKLNGVPWDEFVRSIYLPVNNKIVKGNFSINGTVKVKNLQTKKLNGFSLVNDDPEKLKEFNFSCETNSPAKTSKLLPHSLNPDWNDSFLQEILNESESEFENDVTYFPETRKINGDVEASRIFVRNPFDLSGTTVNLANFTETFWMANQNQTINVPVEFLKGFSVNNLINVKTINEKSLDSFARIDRPNEFFSEVIFENVEITGNAIFSEDVKQNVNLKELNETAAKIFGENVVSGSLRFLENVTANKLNVNVFNGFEVKNFEDLIERNLQNADKLKVSELTIGGDLILENGTQVNVLNGVNFNETISKILTWDDPEVLSKAGFESLTVHNLDADFINGINVENLLPVFSKIHRKDVTVVVEGNLKVPSIQANKVNDVNFDNFMKRVFMRNESLSIMGEKTFEEPVTIIGNLKGTLNKYNVTELAGTALSKTKSQEITGIYTVDELKANYMEADILDGVPTDTILFQDENSEQIINSDVIFENMAIAGDINAANFMKECDLNKITKIDFEKMTDFENLDVRGSVSWEFSRGEQGGLSYFLNNVVSKNEDQVISGPVTFENNVRIKNVKGSRYFNDVDLDFISEDAVLKSPQEQEILATVTFKGPVKVNGIDVINDAHIDTINGIDITDIGQRLVRKSSNTVVTGRKIFKNGFIANHFNADTINGAKVSQIVFYDDVEDNKELFLPPTTFNNIKIYNDLQVSRVNGYFLNKILRDRLSKVEDETSTEIQIRGNVTVEGNVIIKNDAYIKTINDVSIEETVLTDEEISTQVITGDVEFLNDISITDRLDVDYVNGENITALFEKALLVDEDAIIEGNIEFLSNVTINGNMTVNATVNRCDLDKVISADFPNESEDVNRESRESLRREIDYLENITSAINKPLIFMYLEEAATLDIKLPTMHSSAFNRYKDFIEFNVYGMKYSQCGLPTECYCPTQSNFFIESMDPPSIRVEDNSSRFFKHFDEELQVEVKVMTNTVSYSRRCSKGEEEQGSEHTSISWRDFENDETIFEVNVEKGFLSDVKFFKLGDSIYVVMGFYYHPMRNQTNNLHTVVYEIRVNDKTLEKVDEIPSTGVQVLEVFWTTEGVVLVVGNSFDSNRITDSVDSGVYRFNERKNKFELLRFVKTHGVLAIKSVRYKKTSFIFFIQKQSWPLLILKYNHEYDNYYFSQKLDTTRSMIKSNFVSITVISTGTPGYSGDIFMGIVLSDDSFRLFKYKHIEGFVEESYQEQNNVRIIQPFRFGSTQYLLAGSALGLSKIYKIVEQGR